MVEFDEDAGVDNHVLQLEILIDRPVSQVWAQWIDLGSWITSHSVEQLHGEPGTLGAIARVSFRRSAELGLPLPHHHYNKIIKIEFERQYVLKSYPEKGGSYGFRTMVGFDDARFIPMGDQTKVIFNFYGEETGAHKPADASVVNYDEDNHMMKNLENLKRIVELQPRPER